MANQIESQVSKYIISQGAATAEDYQEQLKKLAMQASESKMNELGYATADRDNDLTKWAYEAIRALTNDPNMPELKKKVERKAKSPESNQEIARPEALQTALGNHVLMSLANNTEAYEEMKKTCSIRHLLVKKLPLAQVLPAGVTTFTVPQDKGGEKLAKMSKDADKLVDDEARQNYQTLYEAVNHSQPIEIDTSSKTRSIAGAVVKVGADERIYTRDGLRDFLCVEGPGEILENKQAKIPGAKIRVTTTGTRGNSTAAPKQKVVVSFTGMKEVNEATDAGMSNVYQYLTSVKNTTADGHTRTVHSKLSYKIYAYDKNGKQLFDEKTKQPRVRTKRVTGSVAIYDETPTKWGNDPKFQKGSASGPSKSDVKKNTNLAYARAQQIVNLINQSNDFNNVMSGGIDAATKQALAKFMPSEASATESGANDL